MRRSDKDGKFVYALFSQATVGGGGMYFVCRNGIVSAMDLVCSKISLNASRVLVLYVLQ